MIRSSERVADKRYPLFRPPAASEPADGADASAGEQARRLAPFIRHPLARFFTSEDWEGEECHLYS